MIERVGVFASLEEDTGHSGEVVLQSVIDAGHKARTERYFEHPAEEFDLVAALQAAGAFEYLYGSLVSAYLDDLCKKLGAFEVDVAKLILGYRTVYLHCHQVGYDARYFSCCIHYSIDFLLFLISSTS